MRHAGDADGDFRDVLQPGVRGRAGGELRDGNQRPEGQECVASSSFFMF